MLDAIKAYLAEHSTQIFNMVRTLVVTFGFFFLGVIVTVPDVFAISKNDWKLAAGAGLIAVLKLLLNWFDKGYKRYGRTS